MPVAEPDLPVTESELMAAPLPGGTVAADAVGDAGTPRKPLGPGMWLATVWCILLFLLVLLAPYVGFVQDPDKTIIIPGQGAPVEAGPSLDHWFGTDQNVRDLFARVAWGGRASLMIGFLSLFFGVVIGGFIGITAGYFRGRYERITMSVVDIMLSFPSLILALALLRFLSPPGQTAGSIGKVTLVLSILAIPALAWITRASTLTYSQREFVLAARALGARPWRILRKEVLPNVVPAMVSFSFVALAILIVAEGALAFLGLSVEAPAATWGKLIQSGSEKLDTAADLALFPCGVMFLTLLSLNFIGDRLQERAARESRL